MLENQKSQQYPHVPKNRPVIDSIKILDSI